MNAVLATAADMTTDELVLAIEHLRSLLPTAPAGRPS